VKKKQCFTDYDSYFSSQCFVTFLECGSCPVKPLLTYNSVRKVQKYRYSAHAESLRLSHVQKVFEFFPHTKSSLVLQVQTSFGNIVCMKVLNYRTYGLQKIGSINIKFKISVVHVRKVLRASQV
jgi:hypothetical protein